MQRISALNLLVRVKMVLSSFHAGYHKTSIWIKDIHGLSLLEDSRVEGPCPSNRKTAVGMKNIRKNIRDVSTFKVISQPIVILPSNLLATDHRLTDCGTGYAQFFG